MSELILLTGGLPGKIFGIGSDFDSFTGTPDNLKDASELPRLTQHLLAEGFTREMMVKIWGGNGLRVLREGWKKL